MAARFAFVTLLTSDHYLPGALTAIHSLLDVEGPVSANDFETVCLVTPATVNVETIKALRKVFDVVVGVETILSQSHKELNLLGRPDLVATLTKLHLFRLTQYRKVIYLDADTLILRPLAHLFTTPSTFSAAPDIGWPDCFNSGFMVATPSTVTFDELTSMASERGSWDGGDQGLLNDYFEDNWNRLSFTYNVTPSSLYQYEPAIRRFGQGISVVHFIGRNKPWDRLNRSRPEPSHSAETKNDYNGLLHKWFDIYEKHYGQLSTAAVSGAFGSQQMQASNFVVPRYSAAWEEKGKTVEYRPPSPEELKTMFGGKMAGNYTSMPWEGRQAFEAQNQKPAPPPQPSQQPQIVLSAPSPPEAPAQTTSSSPPRPASPPMFPWNPATQEPNREHIQMREPLDQHYSNVWDDRPKREEFFEAPKYRDIPSAIQSHYDAVTKSKPKDAKAVFPWEGTQQPKATRVFPTETTSIVPPPIPAPAPISEQAKHVNAPAPAPVDEPERRGLPLDFSYSNAWDSIKSIKDYANQLSKPKTKESWRVTSSSSTRKSSAASQRSSSSERSHRAAGRAETGDEGDDEDDGGEEESTEEEKPPIKYKTKPVVSPPNAVRQSRPSNIRPGLQRDNSVGSASRVPTVSSLAQEGSSKHKKTSSLLSQISPLPSPSAYSPRFGTSPSHSSHSSTSTIPPPPKTTPARVFDPATGLESLKKEGLAALQRFVKSMEQTGTDALPQQKQSPSSQQADSTKS